MWKNSPYAPEAWAQERKVTDIGQQSRVMNADGEAYSMVREKAEIIK